MMNGSYKLSTLASVDLNISTVFLKICPPANILPVSLSGSLIALSCFSSTSKEAVYVSSVFLFSFLLLFRANIN